MVILSFHSLLLQVKYDCIWFTMKGGDNEMPVEKCTLSLWFTSLSLPQIFSRKVQNFLQSFKFPPPARDMQKLREKTNESAYYSTAVMSAMA